MSERATAGKRRKRHEEVEWAVADVVDSDTGSFDDADEDDDAEFVRDGFVLDFISGTREMKETPKELVRQRIARALFHEYGISVNDMEADFPVSVGGRRRRVDIAIFAPGKPHTSEHLRRVVVCRPEPKQNKRGAVKMRDYEQAAKDIEEIKPFFEECEECEYGLWTNGLEFFFVRKKKSKWEVDAEPIGDWPMGDDSIGTRDVVSHAKSRRAQPDMLRTAFRRCHNFIHGNEGMPKDAAFWQFLYLIFCKMHDERAPRERRRFWAGPQEQFTEAGRKEIQKRIEPLFNEIKQEYRSIFRGNEEITLSPRALAFMVSELSKYELTRIDVDAKGAAYQEIVGTNLRGDRGQYFTPRGAIKLVVEILDPKEHEKVLDPACGTGGFLVATLAHMMDRFREEAKISAGDETSEEFQSLHDRLREYASKQVYGCDFDPFLIRASQMNMVMAGDGKGHLYNINSLEFPEGYLPGVEPAKKDIPFGSIDVVMTNPPFGSGIPITDENILRHFHLASIWERTEDGSFRETPKRQSSVAPEVLFIERCLDWLKPGGRMGIVLPDGILGNPAAEYIRWWILRHAWVLASVDLPVETFIVEANVNILTSLLFLKKKPPEVIQREAMSGAADYPVFMAVAEKVGFDRRGNVLYKRSPEGEELTRDTEEIETITVGGRKVARTFRRKEKIVDNDLPEIAERYRAFRRQHAEPGK
ncbi:MAG TPA: N-6 DNA methylase [Myxococcota bacterium]|nr:N-6 DNA methylase [Myxococcota bacterium]HQK52254.1 N-6 DNA methylase [Myxococcota bacterium]